MKCGICAIIKNEQLFLKEWIDWHLSIGFDEICLCEDIDSISHKDITDQYDNVTLLQYNDNMLQYEQQNHIGSFRQYAFYKYFIDKFNDKLDWCAFIDIDEFIHIDNNLHIKELLSEYNNFYALYVYWKFYNANNHIKRPIGLVQDNYTEEVETDYFDNGWKYKSIINFNKRPTQFNEKSNVHNITGNGVNSFKMRTNRIKTYHKIWINHYFTKSWEDWCERFISRGDTYPGHRKIEDFFKLNPNMLEKKDKLLKFYEEKLLLRGNKDMN